MSSNTTRGRSYTSFPRNTKQAYIRTCAKEAREAARRAMEIEQAYTEHNPRQNQDDVMVWGNEYMRGEIVEAA